MGAGVMAMIIVFIICCFTSIICIEKINKGIFIVHDKRIEKLEQEVEELKRK